MLGRMVIVPIPTWLFGVVLGGIFLVVVLLWYHFRRSGDHKQ